MIALTLYLIVPFVLAGICLKQYLYPQFGMTRFVAVRMCTAYLTLSPQGRKLMAVVAIDWLLFVLILIWW